jgi:outer membrane lipoprotein-sorting protein
MLDDHPFEITHRAVALFLSVFCILFFKVSFAADQPSAQDVISKMEQKFLKIENYQVDVSRIYHRNEVVEYREEWRFFFQDPGLVRSEIMLPKKIIMVINQDEAWHYLLEEKKVVKRRIRGLEEKERISLLGRLLKPYEIEGWGLSISSQFGDRLKLIGEKLVKGRKCYLIECKSRTDTPPQMKLIVWIDQERFTVVKRELYKKSDQLVKRTESDNFLEVLPDIWLPRKVESTLHTEKGVAMIRLVLRNIKVNQSIPDTTFQFSPPEGCEVMTLNDKGVIVKEDKVQNAKP